MTDYIVRATAADAAIRAFAITSRDLVETARQDHNTSPIMTAALGRLLSGGAMMGTMLKGEKDLNTLAVLVKISKSLSIISSTINRPTD